MVFLLNFLQLLYHENIGNHRDNGLKLNPIQSTPMSSIARILSGSRMSDTFIIMRHSFFSTDNECSHPFVLLKGCKKIGADYADKLWPIFALSAHRKPLLIFSLRYGRV